EFYLLILFSTLGAIGLILSNHLASIFINIELISLPIFGLMAYSYYHRYALEASLKYIILSGVAASFFLLGIAWIYSITG
ncbi:MAG: proton-conducting transporter membrane subunit, partial [Buchnera aphidicola]|nr:NADH-quinone oxidoreductase subunit N [Buchnera aphidicola]MDE5286101.1 proton-conducting transporter membrane subunit [Buchnera aphidicola]